MKERGNSNVSSKIHYFGKVKEKHEETVQTLAFEEFMMMGNQCVQMKRLLDYYHRHKGTC
jgi:hypothetical protein